MTRTIRLGGFLLALAATGCSSCLDRSRPTPPAAGEGRESPTPVASDPAPRLRPAALAGSWYAAEPERLATEVDALLRAAGESAPAADPLAGREILALISPHAGYAYSGKAAAAGYRLLKGRDIRRVIILGVAHREAFTGASIAEVSHYQTPLGLVPLDSPVIARLRRCPVIRAVAQAHVREHSVEIQLPLLQRVLPRFTLVPLLLGRLAEEDYGRLAEALAEVVDAHTLVVASSDFTHRGPNFSYEVPAGKGSVKDRLAGVDDTSVEQILALNRKGLLAHAARTGTTICGLAPIATLLELLSRLKGVTAKVLSRYTSGDVTEDWSSTVTYVDLAFSGEWPARSALELARSAGEKVFPLSAAEKRTLLRLARASLEAAVRQGSYDAGVLTRLTRTPSLVRQAGAFVTLKCRQGPGGGCTGKGDGLRGCIGTIIPTLSVIETVAQRAASAALEDPRFNRVSPAELPHLTVEVSVLTPPRPVQSAAEIVIGRHGIILRKEGMSATFLPQVAPEQGWDRDTTLSHLARKAGLPPDGWRQGATFTVYEAIVFSEEEVP